MRCFTKLSLVDLAKFIHYCHSLHTPKLRTGYFLFLPLIFPAGSKERTPHPSPLGGPHGRQHSHPAPRRAALLSGDRRPPVRWSPLLAVLPSGRARLSQPVKLGSGRIGKGTSFAGEDLVWRPPVPPPSSPHAPPPSAALPAPLASCARRQASRTRSMLNRAPAQGRPPDTPLTGHAHHGAGRASLQAGRTRSLAGCASTRGRPSRPQLCSFFLRVILFEEEEGWETVTGGPYLRGKIGHSNQNALAWI